MWSHRLTLALLGCLFAAMALHALVTTSLAVSWMRSGPGKGAAAFTLAFLLLALISACLWTMAFVWRRKLRAMYAGGIVPILVLAAIWLAFSAAPVLRMRLF